MGHVVVDDHQDVVNVNAACYDVGSYQHVHLSCLEAVHHVVALSLREVAVHGGAVDFHVFQLAGDVLHLLLLAGEDDDAVQFAGLEQLAHDAQLLGFIAHVGRLLYLLRRFRDGYLHLCRVVQQRACQLLNLVGHGGREHDGLVVLRQHLGYLQDVVRESHVQHAVCLVQHKEAQPAHVHMSHADMREQATRCGNDDVGTHPQSLGFYVEAVAVVAAVDGHAADAVQVVAKALHGLVYLLCQFAGGRHDDAVDGILRVAAVVQHGEDGQQVGCRLACTGLCHADEVLAVQYLGDTLLLYGRHFLEVHVVECVEDVVVQICFFKCHLVGCLFIAIVCYECV